MSEPSDSYDRTLGLRYEPPPPKARKSDTPCNQPAVPRFHNERKYRHQINFLIDRHAELYQREYKEVLSNNEFNFVDKLNVERGLTAEQVQRLDSLYRRVCPDIPLPPVGPPPIIEEEEPEQKRRLSGLELKRLQIWSYARKKRRKLQYGGY